MNLNLDTGFDPSGQGKVWLVFVDGTLAWSHASVEGPVPDAIELWEHLDRIVKREGSSTAHRVCGWRWGGVKASHTCGDAASHSMEHRCPCGALYPS